MVEKLGFISKAKGTSENIWKRKKKRSKKDNYNTRGSSRAESRCQSS